MKKSSEHDGSIDAQLNSLLTVWAQSNALPEARADAIQRGAKLEVPRVDLPPKWWFGFARNLTGALTEASRSWSYAGRS